MSNQGDIASSSPSVATVDTEEFRTLLSSMSWESRTAPSDAFESALNRVIAHIDAHAAAQVAAKDAEIKTLKAALDAQGELTDRYQEIALSAQSAAPVVASVKWISIEDELPDVETDVLVRGKRGDSVCHDVAGLFCGEWQSQGSEDNIRFMVTHWMPIPSIDASSSQPSPAPVAMTDEQIMAAAKQSGIYHLTQMGSHFDPCKLVPFARAILAAQQEAV